MSHDPCSPGAAQHAPVSQPLATVADIQITVFAARVRPVEGELEGQPTEVRSIVERMDKLEVQAEVIRRAVENMVRAVYGAESGIAPARMSFTPK